MDASNDLILTAMKGPYPWSAVSTFANSVDRSGFRGAKVMLASGITLEVRLQLEIAGWEVVDYVLGNTRNMGNYCGERFWPINVFMKAHSSEYRFIIHTDWRDVVVQTDPSLWLENNLGSHGIIGCSEGMNVEEEYYNDWWLKPASPNEAAWQEARKHEICCAGTIAGTSSDMLNLLCTMHDVLYNTPDKPNYAGGMGPLIDQGVLNYLVSVSPFKEITRITNMTETFCASVNWYAVHRWTNRPVPEVRDGVFYPQGKSEPFAIVHQYDRDENWKKAVIERYR
jgi:hypothetical protein